ncbi:substrate-binding periplasmic protein [Zooshikella harenae]|uniref:Transporter substrate-binding domain-containing protein n=1 Tax=Zooshikella harenae TaxID=2827238 RepID=A0ABS5ZIZ5_9GAMM|nr:transporter substrate-binding domain-containing protein [Zooshikella harenae]MBU2714049.1 transporter substrate-binding domain-containing protein [Zooshikella harenae]
MLCITQIANTNEVIHFTNGEWPPFMSQNYKHFGAGSHIVTEAFALEGIEVKYVFLPWKRAMTEAKNGWYDGTILWSKNDERKKHFLLSDAVITLRTVFFHRKDYTFDWKDWHDLSGLTVGVTRGYFYGDGLKQAIEQNIVKADIANSDYLNLKKLLAKRIPLFVAEAEIGYEILATRFSGTSRDLVTNHNRPLREAHWYLLISKQSEKAVYWISKFNHGLKKLKTNGQNEKIMNNVINGKYSAPAQ